ncbi:MAG: SDR family oxidoreductase, partial [Chloroflexi bacterium]|nr:SDR family oxidoreductase [Chloroflexota bacterium]
RAIEEFGRIDILVNNAAYTAIKAQPFSEYTPEEWNAKIDVDLKGVLNCRHAVSPQMMKQQSGKIINLSSAAAKIASPGQTIYGACKAALVNFTKSLSMEVNPHGIQVTAVAPGCIRTEAALSVYSEDIFKQVLAATGVTRMGEPEDVANLIVFLASDEASYLTGQQYVVDGGFCPP